MKLSIVVPCYNEEEGVENLSQKLEPILQELQKEWQLELIFVDDGSKDRTYDLLQQYFGEKEYVKIVKHEVNKNIGAAMRTGFSHSTGDVIVTMDSDCTYDPQEIFAMLGLMKDGASIVTASPYHPQGGVRNVPLYRIFLSKAITQIYRTLTGSKIYTFTALFRAHTRDVVDTVAFQADDFLATAEMLIKASIAGHKIQEHPSVLNVREYGVSKMRLLQVIGNHAKFVGKVASLRFRGSFRKK